MMHTIQFADGPDQIAKTADVIHMGMRDNDFAGTHEIKSHEMGGVGTVFTGVEEIEPVVPFDDK